MAVADTPDQIIRLKSIISPAVIRVNLGNTMLVHVGIHRPNGSKDWTRIDNGELADGNVSCEGVPS